jgi:hypothetical protein
MNYQDEIDKLLVPFAQRIRTYCIMHQRVMGSKMIEKINQHVWQRINNPELELNSCSELNVLRIDEITNDCEYYMTILACDRPEYSLISTELINQIFEEVMAEIKPTVATQTTVTISS